jgi:hypothetical protein
MPGPPASSVSQFIETYHLWSVVVLLCALGLYELLSITVWLWYRLLSEAHEAHFGYKTRCVENRRRYEQVAGEPSRILSHRAGAD